MAKHGKSILQLLVDFIFFCLMIIGVGGAMFKVLAPDGWLKTWLHEIWQLDHPAYALVVAVFALIAFTLAKRWMGGFNPKTSLGDLIMYAWMGLGLYFVVKWLATGGWS
jgi:ABC-type Na+ efflux pump permease subunit